MDFTMGYDLLLRLLLGALYLSVFSVSIVAPRFLPCAMFSLGRVPDMLRPITIASGGAHRQSPK